MKDKLPSACFEFSNPHDDCNCEKSKKFLGNSSHTNLYEAQHNVRKCQSHGKICSSTKVMGPSTKKICYTKATQEENL